MTDQVTQMLVISSHDGAEIYAKEVPAKAAPVFPVVASVRVCV